MLRFRSFVTQAFQKHNVFLMGDAAHTVPPTGAKGMNLAVGDAVLLDEAFRGYYASANRGLLDTYESRALDRVWKGQHFSWWMTSMLHAHRMTRSLIAIVAWPSCALSRPRPTGRVS